MDNNSSTPISWNEIVRMYPDQWVELISYEWDAQEVNPRSGLVKRHSKSRKELHEQFMASPTEDSAIVYTGDMKFPEGTFFSANLHQYSGAR